jgi:intracellular sulfur oxidation DsrE/DsrF family protein
MKKQPSDRRSFLAGASTAALAFGGAAAAQVKAPRAAPWTPARHEKDDWLDEIPGKHRLVFDTTTKNALGEALVFAYNYLRVNRADYGLQDSDMAIVIVVRHLSTSFAFTDAMWAKYGTPMARGGVEDPKTKQAPKINIFNRGDYGDQLPNMGVTLDALAKQGVQFGVCSLATRAIAEAIATATGGNADALVRELVANLVGSARMVPAGIVAVNRAQERGYSLVTA